MFSFGQQAFKIGREKDYPMEIVRWRLLLIGSYAGSALMFLLWFWTRGLGLVPSLWYGLIALGLLMFGIFLSPIRIREGEKPLRPLIGSGLLSGGLVAVILGVFLYATYSDALSRYLDPLYPPSWQLVVQEHFLMMMMAFVIGLVAAGSGGWLLVHRGPPKSTFVEPTGESP